MWHITYIVAPIVGGILAASGFIIARKPDAKELIDKIAPYQGYIGVLMLAAGIWNAIDFLPDVGAALSASPFWAIVILGVIFSELAVGFLLGFGLIAKWIPGESGAEKKGIEIQQKLTKIAVPVGFLSIVVGCLMVYWRFVIGG